MYISILKELEMDRFIFALSYFEVVQRKSENQVWIFEAEKDKISSLTFQ